MPQKLAAPVHHSFPRILSLFLEKMHVFKELYEELHGGAEQEDSALPQQF